MAPTSAKFSYNVPEGSSVYIEVVQDGKTVEAGDVTGPKTGDFDVTGTLKFVLSGDDEDIAAVKLTLDGEEVKAEDQNGRGVYTYTVNFEDVLNDWKRANAWPAPPRIAPATRIPALLRLGFLERRLQHKR